jgi:hypothetical protein
MTPVPRRLLALTALCAACDDGLASAAPEPAAHVEMRAPDAVEPVDAPTEVAPAPTPAPSEALARWLAGATVTDDRFARRILYSWTSARTADRLRRDRELFDDAQMPEGPTAYVQRLEHAAARKDASGELARLLLGHPDLARRRYAWVRPWATRMGIVRPYGDQLIEVVLAPDAIVGRFDPSLPEPWAFRDLDERPIPLARVLADPSRIAAILHVREDGEPHFREYVLCNESAIDSWSLAVPSIEEVLVEDAAAVRELAALADAGVPDDYEDARAFFVEHYAATKAGLEAIAAELDASRQRGRPLRVRPRRAFRPDAAPGLVHVREVPPRIIPIA